MPVSRYGKFLIYAVSITPIRTLKIYDFEDLTPNVSVERIKDKHIWEDKEGRIAAIGYSVSNDYWIEFPGLAKYRFYDDSESIEAFAFSPANIRIVRNTLYRSVLPLALQMRGYEALHASAIVSNNVLFAFCAESGTGKSTLANAFRQNGYEVWSDDAVVITMHNSRPKALALPFHIRLNKIGPEWTTTQHNELDHEAYYPDHFDAENSLELPVGGIFIVERLNEATLGEDRQIIRRLGATEGLVQLLHHAYVYKLAHVTRKEQMVKTYLDVASLVPIYHLTIPSNKDSLSLIIKNLEEVLI